MGFFRELFASFMVGYRQTRAARQDRPPYAGVTLVAVGAPDRALLERLASRLHQLLLCEIDVHPSSVELEIPALEADQEPQCDAEEIGEALDDLAEGNRCFLGVTEVDLFARDLNFVFGFGRDGIALISYNRFLDDDLDKLDERVAKQALSSIGAALDVDRCDEDTCVRAFPNSLEEHDAKEMRLCTECRVGFERGLGRVVGL